MRSSWLYLASAIGTRQRTGLDLHRISGHRDVGDGGVFGFAGAVRDHRGVARALGHLDGGEGFGQRADLVDLDQDGVGDALADAFATGSWYWSRTGRRRRAALSCRVSSVRIFQPSQSPSAMPSSMLMIGYLSTQAAR
jgi:hypothetical protein